MQNEYKFTGKFIGKNFLKFTVIFYVIFGILFTNSVSAKPYFSATTITPTIISQPFDENSEEAKNEVKMILMLQKNPDQKEVEQALREVNLAPEMIVQDVDQSLTREVYPKFYLLLDRVKETSKATSESVKNYWQQKRPYLLNKEIKALIPASTSPSYPSGHTCESHAIAYVAGLLIPEKHLEFHKRAKDISWHRMLVGLHFQKDLRGGKQLALLITGGLLQNKEFQKDFAAAAKELKSVEQTQ